MQWIIAIWVETNDPTVQYNLTLNVLRQVRPNVAVITNKVVPGNYIQIGLIKSNSFCNHT